MTIEELKQRKKELGYTNEVVAELAGVSLETVEKLFACIDYSFITYEERFAIERALLKESELECLREENAYLLKKQGEYTAEDFYSFPDDILVELIDGVIYHLGTPSVAHQEIVSEISYLLKDYVVKNKGECKVLTSPIAVQLDCDDKTIVQPDILVLCDKNKMKQQCVFGAPDMVIEVLSPSTRKYDLTTKMAKYMNTGVREYWIVDLDKKKILVYNWENDEFPRIYGFDDKIPVGVFKGKCIVDFATIYQS